MSRIDNIMIKHYKRVDFGVKNQSPHTVTCSYMRLPKSIVGIDNITLPKRWQKILSPAELDELTDWHLSKPRWKWWGRK